MCFRLFVAVPDKPGWPKAHSAVSNRIRSFRVGARAVSIERSERAKVTILRLAWKLDSHRWSPFHRFTLSTTDLFEVGWRRRADVALAPRRPALGEA